MEQRANGIFLRCLGRSEKVRGGGRDLLKKVVLPLMELNGVFIIRKTRHTQVSRQLIQRIFLKNGVGGW